MTDATLDDIPAPDPADFGDDQKARAELDNWNRYDEISRQKKRNTYLVHKTIGLCVPVAIIMAVALFLATVIVYTIHLLIPVGRQWLNKEQLDVLHNMIFSGVVGGAVATAARIYLLEDNRKGRDDNP